LTRSVYPIYRRVMEPVRRSRPLARRLFGIECPGGSPYFLWDLVTLGLRRVVCARSLEGLSVCDMGCGPVAALSVLAAGRGCSDVTGVDVVPEFIEHARAVLDMTEADVELVLSDFGRELGDRSFDLILYNSAYIPDEWGEREGINRGYALETVPTAVTWSGGEDGTDSIREFLLSMPSHLGPGGSLILGFNRLYVPESRVDSVVEESDLRVERTWRWRLLPAVVLEIRR